jgi:rhodanese-related sulfurtransferase
MARPDAVSVLDVRSPAEFETVHIPGSLNVPLDLLAQNAEAVGARLEGAVVLVCQSGVRAAHAQRCLARVGVDNARILHGGIAAYLAAGAEVVRGRARWSLERQVRLVAGPWSWPVSLWGCGCPKHGCSRRGSAPG